MDELIEPFARLLVDVSGMEAVRAVERGGDWRSMWQAFAQSGFLDALVPEADGGAGLEMAQIGPLLTLLGRHAVPLPVGETMLARALLARAGRARPDGPVVMATGSGVTPGGAFAEHVLHGALDAPELTALTPTYGTSNTGDLDIVLDVPGSAAMRPVCAMLRAHLIAGAAAHVLDLTLAYANDRVQFGKPIGRQQALQQQLAVLAEQSVAARIAAEIGSRGDVVPSTRDAAVAKHGASVAAAEIAGIAHAVFGAIGISEEHDLQMLTRRLHTWRLSDGSAAYWAGEVGRIRIGLSVASTVAWFGDDGREASR